MYSADVPLVCVSACIIAGLPLLLAQGVETPKQRRLLLARALFTTELTVDGMAFGDPLRDPRGYGVLFFAYGLHEQTLLKYYYEALETAQSFKRLDPRLPIAIATNVANASASGVFDHVVRIRQDHIFAGGYKKALLDAQGRPSPFVMKVNRGAQGGWGGMWEGGMARLSGRHCRVGGFIKHGNACMR